MQRVTLVGSVALAAVALTAPAVAANATAVGGTVAPYTAIVVNGTESGGSFVRDTSTNSFTMFGSRTVVHLQGNEIDTPPFAILSAADPVVVGDLAVNGTDPEPGRAPAERRRPAEECVVTGTVHVTEATFGADDVATSFAADYSGTCQSGQPSSGQIRFNSSTGYQGLDITATKSWSAPFVGEQNAPTTVTVTARGTQSTTISAVDVVGGTPANFVVCTARTPAPGSRAGAPETCTVTVAAGPQSLTPASVTEHLQFSTSQSTSPVGTTLSYTAPKVSKRGQYFPTSARMMDTRLGTGVRKGVVNGGSSVSLPVAGHNGVPATGVSAAVFNVTVTGATASSTPRSTRAAPPDRARRT